MADKKPNLPSFRLLPLLLLLLISCGLLLPLGAVPSTRNLALRNQEAAAFQAADVQVMESRERRMMEEQFARMMIESNDYPGSGANNRHDPKSPGRA